MNYYLSKEMASLSIIGMLIILFFALSLNHTSPNFYVRNYSSNSLSAKTINTVLPDSVVTYTEITPSDALTMINDNSDTLIIDVSELYKNGHIPDSINIPLKKLSELSVSLDKNKSYIIYCRNNIDSLVGIQKFVNLGFQKLYRISGGYNAWVRSGYKTEK